MNENEGLLRFIAETPTAYHAVENTARALTEAGYTALAEGEKWSLVPGGKYYTARNGSSLLAFRLPKGEPMGFLLTAAHGDSPCFKLREEPEQESGGYVRLSAEKYGGMLCAPWMDRPLSAAGRVTLKAEGGISVRTVDLRVPLAVIPSVAIHMNRAANEGASYNPTVDMVPLFSAGEGKNVKVLCAEALGVDARDILTTDLFLYNPQPGVSFGGMISAPRLDDLQCVYAALRGFLTAGESESVAMLCLFDNEEVGSETKQGAASSFLHDTMERICAALGVSLAEKLPHSFMISCDNAHAVHPNHPEYADKGNGPRLNGGIVIKYNANQKYTTDAVSAALFTLLCEEVGVKLQRYANRPDLPGGSTLGSIANTKVAMNTVDIGLPQLAMHSSFETAGAEDTETLIRVLRRFYETSLRMTGDGFVLR